MQFGLTYVLQCYRQQYARVITSVVGEKRIELKPIMIVSAKDYQYLQQHPINKFANNNIFLREQQLIQYFNLTNQESAPSSHRQHATCLQANFAKFKYHISIILYLKTGYPLHAKLQYADYKTKGRPVDVVFKFFKKSMLYEIMLCCINFSFEEAQSNV